MDKNITAPNGKVESHIAWIEELIFESLSCSDCEWCAEEHEYCESCKWKINFVRAQEEKIRKCEEAFVFIATDLDFKINEEWVHRLQRRMKRAGEMIALLRS